MIELNRYLILLGLILISLVTTACGESKSMAQPERSRESDKIKAAAAQEVEVRGTCTLRPAQVVRLKAQIGGQIKAVLVEQGSVVRAGQVLATMNIEDLNLRRQRAVLELEKLSGRAELLQYQITRAEKEWAIVSEMSGNKASNYLPRFGKEMAALEERRSDLRENRLNQDLSRLDLQTIDEQIRKANIQAPFDGMILSRNVEPGMVVGSGSESIGGGEVLFEVANPKKLVAACIVKESDALTLTTGNTATIFVDVPGHEPITAKVGRISPVITSEAGLARRAFQVELGSRTSARLLPGMNAEVQIGSR